MITVTGNAAVRNLLSDLLKTSYSSANIGENIFFSAYWCSGCCSHAVANPKQKGARHGKNQRHVLLLYFLTVALLILSCFAFS